MLCKKRAYVFVATLLTLTGVVSSWTFNNVKDTEKRSFGQGVNEHVPDDTDSSEYLQDWLAGEIGLQRRADEELRAAEIAAAEQEYERIKYDKELKKLGVKKRARVEAVKGEKRRNKAETGVEHENTHLQKRRMEEVKESGTFKRVKRRVKMGRPNLVCDDAKMNLDLDWDPADPANAKDYTCNSTILHPKHQTFDVVYHSPQKPNHICMWQKVSKLFDPPTSGSHRPLWAKYGKYTYVPWQRWLHNLEHGAIGLLYHKCADPGEVAAAENILVNCMRRHIITPYELPPDKPLGLVSWGYYLPMSHFDRDVVINFIKQHAMHGRENLVYQNGDYEELLVKPARIVSDMRESAICPQSRYQQIYNKTLGSEISARHPQEAFSTEHKTIAEKQQQQRQQKAKQASARDSTDSKRDAIWLKDREPGLEKNDVRSELKRGVIKDVSQLVDKVAEQEVKGGGLDEVGLELDAKLSELEKKENLARLQRKETLARLEKDLDTVKKLFHQKIKPLIEA